MFRRTVLLSGLAAVAGAAGWWVAPRLAPVPGALLEPREVSPVFVARDGKPLRQLLAADGQRVGRAVTLDEVPAHLIAATLAAEDRRFWSHGGVDWMAVARAARSNFKNERVVSGASTITMQLIKNASPHAAKRTVATKMREALQARHLEMVWSKEEILAAYLNRISYGNLFTGCAAAASGYFNKPLRDLTAAECAFLAALPQAPGLLNPFRDPAPALARQRRILEQMHEQRRLTDEEFQAALHQEIKLDRFAGGFAAPHAVELVTGMRNEEWGMQQEPLTLPSRKGRGDGMQMPEQAEDLLHSRRERGDGGAEREQAIIRTTIDFDLQRKVETIIAQRLAGLESRHVTHAAAVVIENRTGHVLALVGSRDFFAKDGGQINGAWAPHSPGSAVKPFTYLLAFEKGHTPATVVADLPIEFATPTGTYRPENYDRKLFGPMTYRTALGNSLNISAVKVLQSIGGAEVLLEKLRKLGISTLDEEAEHYGLGLTIGNAPVRLLELANAYACLARLGVWKPWALVAETTPGESAPHLASPKGRGTTALNAETGSPSPLGERPGVRGSSEIVAEGAAGVGKMSTLQARRQEERLFREAECFLIADILSDNQARLLCFGAHSPLRLPFPVAAKTGTSSTYRDNWTLGYTPEFTVGVWAGNFDNTPMENVSGVTGAAPIFRDIFIDLHERFGTSWFEEPREIVHARIDPRNGKQLGPQSPSARLSRDEIFVRGAEPPMATASDYEAGTGRAILPPEFAKWAASRDNWLGDLVACGDAMRRPFGPPRIVHPIPGTVVRLDPDIGNNGNRLLLEVEASGEVQWSSPTLKVLNENGNQFAILTPGRHEIVATLADGGGSAKTWVIVERE